MPSSVLILPGIDNSGPQHWQTLWEQSHRGFQRIQQRDWHRPDCEEWASVMENAARRAGPDTVLVAHSLSCLVVAHWAAQQHAPIKAALLVAPPDSAGPNFPKDATGFSKTAMLPFSFPSTVVTSTNDPYSSIEHAARLANAWGSRLVDIGAYGHINADSGLGDWPQGYHLLEQMMR